VERVESLHERPRDGAVRDDHVSDVSLGVRVELRLVRLQEVVPGADHATPAVEELGGDGRGRVADRRLAHGRDVDAGRKPLLAVLPRERVGVVVAHPAGDEGLDEPLVHRRKGAHGGEVEQPLRNRGDGAGE
jgi:hypothetical protein